MPRRSYSASIEVTSPLNSVSALLAPEGGAETPPPAPAPPPPPSRSATAPMPTVASGHVGGVGDARDEERASRSDPERVVDLVERGDCGAVAGAAEPVGVH